MWYWGCGIVSAWRDVLVMVICGIVRYVGVVYRYVLMWDGWWYRVCCGVVWGCIEIV